MNVLVIATVVIVSLVVFGIWYLKRENFADYPFENDFMKLYYSDIAEDPKFIKKFPYWGTGPKVGLRCRKPNNVGCDTMWVSGRLVEITPTLKKKLECKYGIPFEKILTNMV